VVSQPGAHDLGQLEQHAAAILRGRVLPGPVVERGARRLHRARDVGGSGIGDARDRLRD